MVTTSSPPQPPPPPPKRNIIIEKALGGDAASGIIEKALSGGAASGTSGTSVTSGSTTTTFGSGGTKTVTTPKGKTYTTDTGQVVSNVSTSGGVPLTIPLNEEDAKRLGVPEGTKVFIPQRKGFTAQDIQALVLNRMDYSGIGRDTRGNIYGSKDNKTYTLDPLAQTAFIESGMRKTTTTRGEFVSPMISDLNRVIEKEQKQKSFLDKLFSKPEMQPKEPKADESGVIIVPKSEIRIEPKNKEGIKGFFSVFYDGAKTLRREKGEQIFTAIDEAYKTDTFGIPSLYTQTNIIKKGLGDFFEAEGISLGQSYYEEIIRKERSYVDKYGTQIVPESEIKVNKGYMIVPESEIKTKGSMFSFLNKFYVLSKEAAAKQRDMEIQYDLTTEELLKVPTKESLKSTWGIGGRFVGEIGMYLNPYTAIPRTVIELGSMSPSQHLKNPLETSLTVAQGFSWTIGADIVKAGYLNFKTSKAGLSLLQTAPKVSTIIDVTGKGAELGFRYGLPISFVTSEAINIYGRDEMGLLRYPTYQSRKTAVKEFGTDMAYFNLGGMSGSKVSKESGLTGYVITREAILKGTSMESLFARGISKEEFFKIITKGAETPSEYKLRIKIGERILNYRTKQGRLVYEKQSSFKDIFKGLTSTKKTTRPGNVPQTKQVYSLTDKGFDYYKKSIDAYKDLFKSSMFSERASGIPVKGGKAPLTKVESLLGKFKTLNPRRILDLGAGERPSKRANYAADILNYKSNLRDLKAQKPTKQELLNLKRLKANYIQIDYNKKITGASNTFDEILSSYSVGVFSNKQAYKNIYNMLKPGGKFNIRVGDKPKTDMINYLNKLGFKNVRVLETRGNLKNKSTSSDYNIVGTKPGKLPSSIRTIKGLPEVVFNIQKKYGLILGGSTILASYYTPKQMLKSGFKSPGDGDLFLPNKAGVLTKLYLAIVGSRLKKGFESKGLKIETELSGTSYKIFGYQKATGAKKAVRTKLLELHSKELLELMPTGGIYTTQSFSDFARGSFGFERIRRTTSGTKVLDIGTQKRNLLLGGFYADRASKDLPRFFKSLSLEMDYAKARGLSNKAYNKYITTKEKNLPFVTSLMKEQLFMRGESKDWKTLKVDFKFREPTDILEMFKSKSKPRQEKIKLFEPYTRITKGYEPFKTSTKQKYTNYKQSKSYSIAGSYKPYYKTYKGYGGYNKGYGGYKGYEPYEPYKPYQGYKPYQPYNPYKPYQPYKPYTPYKPYQPYKLYKFYQGYKPYTTYKPAKEVPPPPIDFKFKIGEIGKLFKPTKKGKRKFKYTSNLRSVEFNIYGKMPKILTGFSDRPLLK